MGVGGGPSLVLAGILVLFVLGTLAAVILCRPGPTRSDPARPRNENEARPGFGGFLLGGTVSNMLRWRSEMSGIDALLQDLSPTAPPPAE